MPVLTVVAAICCLPGPTNAARVQASSVEGLIARLATDDVQSLDRLMFRTEREDWSFLLDRVLPPPTPGAALGDIVRIVRLGADAVPTLCRHLADATRTQLSIPSTQATPTGQSMRPYQNYDHRVVMRAELSQAQIGAMLDATWGGPFPAGKPVTVGDLCYFALGEIVDRWFFCASIREHGMLFVNMPSLMPELAAKARGEWGRTTRSSLLRSLKLDATYPDIVLRDFAALSRLRWFYPESVPDVVVARISEPITFCTWDGVAALDPERFFFTGTLTPYDVRACLQAVAGVPSPKIDEACRKLIQRVRKARPGSDGPVFLAIYQKVVIGAARLRLSLSNAEAPP